MIKFFYFFKFTVNNILVLNSSFQDVKNILIYIYVRNFEKSKYKNNPK